MCSSKYDFQDNIYHRSGRVCRLCLFDKNSTINMFETTASDGSNLVKILNDFIGMDATRGDGLPEEVCFDCLDGIRRLGKISYNLWNTLNYLIQMEKEKVACPLNKRDLYMPEDNIAFLLAKGKNYNNEIPVNSTDSSDCIPKPTSNHGVQNNEDIISDDEEMEVHYCWCTECNEDFISLKDLKLHAETHRKDITLDHGDKGIQKSDTEGVMELYVYKNCNSNNQLSCARCGKAFKDRKRLSKHIIKYDFKCKQKDIENWNDINCSLKGVEHSDLPSISNESILKLDRNLECSKYRLDDLEANNRVIKEYLTESGKYKNSKLDGDRILRLKKSHVTTNMSRHGTPCKKHPAILNFESRKLEFDADGLEKDFIVQPKSNERPGTFRIHSMESKSSCDTIDQESVDVFVCNDCGKSHKDKQVLRNHIVQCHTSFSMQHCPKCFKVFTSEEELEKHCNLHSSDEKFFCSVCKNGFISKETLVTHMKESHESEAVFMCSACQNGFPSRVELGVHHSSNLCAKKYSCSNCDRRFMWKTTLNAHIRVCQLKLPSFKCEICEKVLSSKQNLEFHSRIHLNLKPFQCHICSKRFYQSSKVLIHIRGVHLKIKPHECGICKKKFCFKAGLQIHYTSHSDERPFVCIHCPSAFKFKCALKRHLNVVHKIPWIETHL